ncbi:hypothetical protein G7085_10930 [Tessaracoccus sp. HDW20]|uniref:hypothetical protein n=1 Tax=Tessaracoccus coleopterorum TaxID=2714950 RepID=UPI0018D3223C|nr:hypothetical protein [Tessaracoccus coleopterorum]NHB84949.1 hypothetical protein [Tessaracoccus coleopterorum]
MLGIYLSHRIHLGDDAEAWKDVQAVVGAQNAEAEDAVTKLLTDRMLRFDRAETAEALGRVAVCERVPDLLAWIGAGRAVTATGAIRRADLRFTAGLLGIDVIGVNRRPRQPGGIGAALPVLSMDAVPPLTIWWDHLLNSRIIELDGSRVRRGPRADAFLADRQDERLTLTYDIALSAALTYVIEDAEWNISTARAFEILAAALVRGEDDVDTPLSRELESLPLTREMVKAAGSPVVTRAWVGDQADHIINEFARIGLLEMSANGRPRVRRGLGCVLGAVLLRVRSHLPAGTTGSCSPSRRPTLSEASASVLGTRHRRSAPCPIPVPGSRCTCTASSSGPWSPSPPYCS